MLTDAQKSFLKRFVPLAAFLGGLCCFTPVVLVLLGLSTTAFAASLADTLYGTYKWAFRIVAVLFLGAALWWYLYKREQICTFDALKRQRRKVLNLILASLIAAAVGYIIWLYVIVELLGKVLGIWQ